MNRPLALALLSLTFVANASAQSATGAAPAADAPPAPVSPWSVIAAERPALAGPLAKVTFGQKRKTAQRKVRGLKKDGTALVGRIDQVIVRIEAPHGNVSRVVLYLPEQGAAEELNRLWGTTDTVRVRTVMTRRWLDAQAHIRATLRDTRDANYRGYDELVLEPYVSLSELVGTGPGPFAFERMPLLGAQRKPVQKAFDAVEWQRKGKVTPRVYLPATAFSPTNHVVELRLVDKRVGSFSMPLSYDEHAPDKAAILKAFEKKLGPSVYDADPVTNTTTYRFRRAPGVSLLLNPRLKRYTLTVTSL